MNPYVHPEIPTGILFEPLYTFLNALGQKGKRERLKSWCLCLLAKMGQNRLKMCSIHMLEHPKRSRINFGKVHFRPNFGCEMAYFQGIWHLWQAIASPNSLKLDSTTSFGILNGLGSFLGKCGVDPFWTHFWSQNSPLSRHFGNFGVPKWVTIGSKQAKPLVLESYIFTII